MEETKMYDDNNDRWEDIKEYQVSDMSTSYEEWIASYIYNNAVANHKHNEMPEDVKSIVWFGTKTLPMDLNSIEFAKNQTSYMLKPTASNGYDMLTAYTVNLDSLDCVTIDGPLYKVEPCLVDDESNGKTDEGEYMDMKDFTVKIGKVFPKKLAYRVRYGVKA